MPNYIYTLYNTYICLPLHMSLILSICLLPLHMSLTSTYVSYLYIYLLPLHISLTSTYVSYLYIYLLPLHMSLTSTYVSHHLHMYLTSTYVSHPLHMSLTSTYVSYLYICVSYLYTYVSYLYTYVSLISIEFSRHQCTKTEHRRPGSFTRPHSRQTSQQNIHKRHALSYIINIINHHCTPFSAYIE